MQGFELPLVGETALLVLLVSLPYANTSWLHYCSRRVATTEMYHLALVFVNVENSEGSEIVFFRSATTVAVGPARVPLSRNQRLRAE